MRLYLPTGQKGETNNPQASQPLLPPGIWEWHPPGLEAPLAYYGTSWPFPVPPMHRQHFRVIPPLPLAVAW